MTNDELEARADPLIRELQRVLVAHTDSLPISDAELVQSIALTITLALHSVELGRVRLGRVPTLDELIRHCLRAPWQRAGQYALARCCRGSE